MATQDDVLKVKSDMEAVMQRVSDAGGTEYQINDAAVHYGMQLASSGQTEHARIAALFLNSLGLVRESGRVLDISHHGENMQALDTSPISEERAAEILGTTNSDSIVRAVDEVATVNVTDDGQIKLSIGDDEKDVASIGEDGKIIISYNQGNTRAGTSMVYILPNPAGAGSEKIEETVRGLKADVNRSMKDEVAALVLKQANAPVNRRNIITMTDAIKNTRWMQRQSRDTAKRLRGDNYVLEVENAIRNAVDPEVYELSKDHSGQVQEVSYNRMVSGGEALRDIAHTNPAVAVWLRDSYHRNIRKYEHPGEIINDVRSAMVESGMDPSSWRTFSRMDPTTMSYIVSSSTNAGDPGIATVVNAMTKYQIRDPNQHQIRLAHALTHALPINYRDLESEVRLQSMGHIIGLALKADDPPQTDADAEATARMLRPYIREQQREEQPITSTTWRGLYRLGDRWTRDEERTQMEQRMQREAHSNDGKIKSWGSLTETIIPQSTKINPSLRAHFLTNVADLHREGVNMQHCVGEYGDRCWSGDSRIFTIRGEGDKRVATAEINQHDNQWVLGQLYGPSDHRVTSEVRSFAKEVATQYQDAWENASEEERNEQNWIHIDDAQERLKSELEYRARPTAPPQPPTPAPLNLDDIPQVVPAPSLQDEIGRYIAQQAEIQPDHDPGERAVGYVGARAPQGRRDRIGRGQLQL